MAAVAETQKLLTNIVRLRQAEAAGAAVEGIAAVRRDLEDELGPTLSRSRSARILGVSQTALDRWVASGHIPTVITPRGKREIPRRFAIELAEDIAALRENGPARHPLAEVLRRRQETSARTHRRLNRDSRSGRRADPRARDSSRSRIPRGHRTAEQRSLAFHRAVAERLDKRIVHAARECLVRLRRQNRIQPLFADLWQEILAKPLSEIADLITEDTQKGRDLRQSTPFAGALDEQERRRVIEAVH